jgi:hypothetical protein
VNPLESSYAALHERIDFLTGLGETTFFDIEEQSTLFVDDVALDPLGASALPVAEISATAAHLGALRVLLAEGEPPRASTFVLLRAALETASAAVWLLEPDDRDERLRRALRRHWADLGEADAMSRALTGVDLDDGAGWTGAHGRWFVGVAPGAAQEPVDTSVVVSAAAEVVEDFTETGGAAAVITSGWTGFGSVAITRFRVDGEMFAGSLSMVLDAAETAISLFHARASSASRLPDDAPTLAHLRGR